MMAEFGWLKSEVYGVLTVSLLCSALAALPMGSAIDAGHGRRVMTVGSLLAGLIFMLGSRLESLSAFYLVFASIGFLHAATLSMFWSLLVCFAIFAAAGVTFKFHLYPQGCPA